MALSFTEGSIGADFERVPLSRCAASTPAGARCGPWFPAASRASQARPPAITRTATKAPARDDEPRGSNGIAIAPAITQNGRALLLINPHTSFFFRSELQMTSEEGLNAYGAATWGQFFIYQGFNERVGWMHTTSGLDSVDEFAERVSNPNSGRPPTARV
jgi:acyl-homoserine-lactone acylase